MLAGVTLLLVTSYGFFAQNFLLPTLGSIVVLIIGARREWSWRNQIIGVFVVSAVAYLVSATIVNSLTRSDNLLIVGTVVDETTHSGVGQARVSLVGTSDYYLSEDNGNFRFDATHKARRSERVRLHVEKNGYRSIDETIAVPSEDVVLVLSKL